MFKKTLLLILISYSVNSTYLVKWFEEDSSSLSNELKHEIAGYKEVVSKLMTDIKNNASLGEVMYQKYVEFIDTFGARPSGSQVLEDSIDHMINLTRSMGVHDVITEEVQVPRWLRGQETAYLITPLNKTVAILGLGTSVSTSPQGITAKVIVFNSFEELESASDESVKGKIVVYNEDFTTYGNTAKYRSQGATKAARKGAVAALVKSITPFSLYTPHTGAQHYDDEDNKIPVAAITMEDAELLWRLQKAGEDISLHITMINTLSEKTSRNTLIDLKGSQYPNKQVIVSGHIDSWDVGTGAMDDGGGLFISWFVPIVLKHLNFTPKRTVRAILWTAEEFGLIGAEAYLNRHRNELDDINFIMESDEGTFKPEGLDIAGTFEARSILKEVLNLFAPINKLTNSGSPGSDISIFTAEGIPGASLLNANERYFWYHHTEADTLSVQNKEHVIECAAFWAAYSYIIADLSVDLPRHRRTGYQ